MNVNKIGAGVFTIDRFLSASECDAYSKKSESLGYEQATINAITGPEINKEIRNNDRVILDDRDIAGSLYRRAKDYLPEKVDDW